MKLIESMRCIIGYSNSKISLNLGKSVYGSVRFRHFNNLVFRSKNGCTRYCTKAPKYSFLWKNWKTENNYGLNNMNRAMSIMIYHIDNNKNLAHFAIKSKKINNPKTFSTSCTENLKGKDRKEFTEEEIKNINQLYRGTLQVNRTQMKAQEGNGHHSSSTYHHGLVADRSFTKGDIIVTGKVISISSFKCTHSIQLDYKQHAIMDMPAILMNHSCNANVGVVQQNYKNYNNIDTDDVVCYNFYAIRNIPSGMGLYFDYDTVEYEIDNFPRCSCGQKNCRKQIRGFRHSGDIVTQLYGPKYVARYLMSTPEDFDENN